MDIRPGLILEVKTAHTLLGIHEFIYGQFVLNEFRKTLICRGLKNTVRSYEYSSLSYFLLMKKIGTFAILFSANFLKVYSISALLSIFCVIKSEKQKVCSNTPNTRDIITVVVPKLHFKNSRDNTL